MSIRITDEAMTSDSTPDSARADGDGWALTWLPGRVMTRSHALRRSIGATAGTLAPSRQAMLPYPLDGRGAHDLEASSSVNRTPRS
jgi:hypothetical protein